MNVLVYGAKGILILLKALFVVRQEEESHNKNKERSACSYKEPCYYSTRYFELILRRNEVVFSTEDRNAYFHSRFVVEYYKEAPEEAVLSTLCVTVLLD